MKICSKQYCISKSEEIANLFNQSFTNKYTKEEDLWKPFEIEEALCNRIKSLNWNVILIEENKKVVAIGASALNTTKKSNNIKLFEKINYNKKYFNSIKWLAVNKNKQKIGLGGKLLNELLNCIKNNYIVTVSCSKHNISYYEKFGFVVIGQLPNGNNPKSEFFASYLMALKGTFQNG